MSAKKNLSTRGRAVGYVSVTKEWRRATKGAAFKGPKQKSGNGYPAHLGPLGLKDIQAVIRAKERGADRYDLARKHKVTPNLIDWCQAHRTQAKNMGHPWPFLKGSDKPTQRVS